MTTKLLGWKSGRFMRRVKAFLPTDLLSFLTTHLGNSALPTKVERNLPCFCCTCNLQLNKTNPPESYILLWSYLHLPNHVFTTKGLNAFISPSIYNFFRKPYNGKSDLIAAVRDLVILKPQQKVTHCF